MNEAAEREEFFKLLAEMHGEQVYQSFLEKHTRFIPREFIQNHGLHLGLVLRKLPFGADYKSDLFYFAKSSDDWNAVFVELEKPSSKFFKGNTNEFHPDFLRAIQQINQWMAWFLDERNKGTFLATVNPIRVPYTMARNPTYTKYVLVFGRRSEYSSNEERQRLVKSMERESFKIVTFDSLAEDLENKSHVSIGVRHNQFIDILTDDITSPALYTWVESTRLRVSKRLHEKLGSGPRSNSFVPTDNGEKMEAFTRAAPLVRVRSE